MDEFTQESDRYFAEVDDHAARVARRHGTVLVEDDRQGWSKTSSPHASTDPACTAGRPSPRSGPAHLAM